MELDHLFVFYSRTRTFMDSSNILENIEFITKLILNLMQISLLTSNLYFNRSIDFF